MNNAVKTIGKVALASIFALSEAAYSGSIATIMDSKHPENTSTRVLNNAKACDSYTDALSKQINKTYFNNSIGFTISMSCIDDQTGKVTKNEVCDSDTKMGFNQAYGSGNIINVEIPTLTCNKL